MSFHPDERTLKAPRDFGPSDLEHEDAFQRPSDPTAVGSRSTAPPLAGDGLITVQPLRRAEMQPSYAQNLGLDDVEHGFYGSMINALGVITGGLGQIPCCICCPNPFKQVRQGSVGLVSRFGKFYASYDPGLVQVNPCSESIRIVDVKIQLATVPRQVVMTKDNVNLEIDSVLYWHISNPYRAAFGISDVREALIERSQTTLRSVIGARTLQSLIGDREAVAAEIEEIVSATASVWGVSVESILMKDIIFSRELQESLSSAAQARRVGESKVIAATAEVEAARLMRQAADILASPAAMQIRQLDALQSMARASNSKVIFVPMTLGEMGGGAAIADLEENAKPPMGATAGSSTAKKAVDLNNVGSLAQLASM